MTNTQLGGGISNLVTLVEAPGLRTVTKQSLGKLRVEQEWLSDRNRIFREAAAMRWLSSRVEGGHIPAVLAEDPEIFTITMEAAPADAVMWKTRLFEGDLRGEHAAAVGRLLASVISVSWNNAEARELFHDQTVFDQLRIDPYYRFTAARVPEAAAYLHRLIETSAQRLVSIVHGDWSPKNLLVSDAELWAIDWEVVHFGDPSFDVGFLLNHLLMKSIAMPERRRDFEALAAAFLEALSGNLPTEAAWIPEAAQDHLPALLLARVDGKSPAEYLNENMRREARGLAMEMMRTR